MLQHQVPYVSDAGWSVAITVYVVRDNLFHIGAQKPFGTLFIGLRDLLIEGGSGELAAAALLRTPHRRLQLRQVRTGDQHFVVDVHQQGMTRRGRERPGVANGLHLNLRWIRIEPLAFFLQEAFQARLPYLCQNDWSRVICAVFSDRNHDFIAQVAAEALELIQYILELWTIPLLLLFPPVP